MTVGNMAAAAAPAAMAAAHGYLIYRRDAEKELAQRRLYQARCFRGPGIRAALATVGLGRQEVSSERDPRLFPLRPREGSASSHEGWARALLSLHRWSAPPECPSAISLGGLAAERGLCWIRAQT
jgi:hypothetical protein